MIKLLALGIAILTCVTFGAYKAFAYAPPKASDKVTVKK